MKIGIDARFYGPHSKGLGRYTQKLIEHLEKHDRTNTYVIFLRRQNFNDYQPRGENFQKVCADYRWYSLKEQIMMPFVLRKHKLDLVHFPHFNIPLFYRKKFVVTIHDLILVHFPTLRATTLNPALYWIKFLAYKIVIARAIRKSAKIFAVSHFTKSDILAHYDIPPEKIYVTHEASFQKETALISSQKAEKFFSRHAILKPYFLYVGNAYPHKNLKRLVRSFGVLNNGARTHHLVLVGKNDYFYQRLERFVAKKKIHDVVILHAISDADLHTIYQKAHAYVFPSLYEGFGLPPLEAMTYDIPVAASDHPYMREILGNSALYFNAKNIHAMKNALQNIATNKKLRQKLISRGRKNIKRFSWDKMAKQTHETYLTVLHQS